MARTDRHRVLPADRRAKQVANWPIRSIRAAFGWSTAKRTVAFVWRYGRSVILFGGVSFITTVFLVIIFVVAVLPAYKNPKARMFTTGLGYGSVLRRQGKPFPVRIASPERIKFSEPILGEGILTSQPVMVPIVPIDFVTRVHVERGDRVKKGQILLELNTSRAQIRVESAELAVSTTESEAKRVHIGSAYVLAQERPEHDEINLNAAERRTEKIREQQAMYTALYEKGIISRSKFLELEKELIEEQRTAQQAMFSLKMSSKGVVESLRIAANALEDAKRELSFRKEELKAYRVYAPCDGVIDRVLTAEGEYNQDTGKPAFLISHGLWFNAHLDQRVIGKVREGQNVQVYLEAYPGTPFHGTITRVVPLVSFNLGGPETNRPIRPRGSGAPEWPATFCVNIDLDLFENEGSKIRLVPGMTGFGQIMADYTSLAVPLASVSSLSAGAGYVHVLDGDKWKVHLVRTGAIQDGWIEVVSGLVGDETLIAYGFEVLEEGDTVFVEGNYWDWESHFVKKDMPQTWVRDKSGAIITRRDSNDFENSEMTIEVSVEGKVAHPGDGN